MHWLCTRLLYLTLLIPLATCGNFPAPMPLIVKSPYFHSWIDPNIMTTANNTWPMFWNEIHVLGWTSRIRVDNTTTYEWIGGNPDIMHRANLTGVNITPTRTIFTFEAGSVGFNATFLSPIDPSDLVRQSLPFGYIYVDAWSLDGDPHSIQIYFDTSGEILSDDLGNVVHWNTTSTGNVVYHSMTLSNPQPFDEERDIANDATLYFAMENKNNMTWQIGIDVVLRGPQGNSTIPLSNSDDTIFRAINSQWPVMAFRVDLGKIMETSESVVWAMGLVRDPVVLDTTSGRHPRTAYYWSAYQTYLATGHNVVMTNEVDALIQDVIGKFDDVKSNSVNLDNKIMSDGAALSSNYVYLLSLSLRLTFGAMDITFGSLANGTNDLSDVKIYMKDLGTSGRVNPVEILYASLPAMLYLNSSLAGLVLDPLLEYQNSSSYINDYAAPDLGSHYPNVSGNSIKDSELALDSCSSMLIMTYAHASKSGDGTLLNRYYDLLSKWTQYLEQSGLNSTEGYKTSDGDAGSYLSNLILKGILGIYAMSRISDAAGRSDDSSRYLSQAQNFKYQWISRAVPSGHITSSPGNTTSTWGLVYNLYAAKLLGATDIIDDEVYTDQSQFYASQLSAAPAFGFPYDQNDLNIAKPHWTMFTAAAMPDTSVRDSLIERVWLRASLDDKTPFPSSYDPNDGKDSSGVGAASPAQGAMFAPLALNLSDKPISGFPASSSTSSRKSSKNVGAIAGGTIAGVVGLCLVIFAVIFWRKRVLRQRYITTHEKKAVVNSPYRVPQSPVGEQGTSGPTSLMGWAIPAAFSKSSRRTDSTGNLLPRGPTSPVGSSVSAPSADLRLEMERLRREMEAMRNERNEQVEPPPLYDFQNRPGATEDHGNAQADGGIIPLVPSRRK